MKQEIHYSISGYVICFCLLLFANESRAQSSYDIYVFDVNTSTTKRVTSIPNVGEWNACWSNNGKKIAHDYAAPNGQSIYITDVQSGVSTPLVGAETGNDPAWSPSGEKIGFDDWEDYYHIGWWTQNIYLVPANGGTRSFFRLGAHHASWNPKGNKIAFDDNYGYIATKDINTGIETFVTYYGDRPSWSPNGQYIAFDGWWWIGGGIWVVKVDTLGNPQELPVQLTTSGYGPTWKNNSRELVFIDWPNGDPDLYSISVDGGISTRICGRTGGFDKGDYDPAYSSNGQYIAWSSYTDENSNVTKKPSEKVNELYSNEFTVALYPNPVRDIATLKIKGDAKNIIVTITNINGQTLWQKKYADQSQISLPAERLTAGIYIVSVKSDSGNKILKLVKE